MCFCCCPTRKSILIYAIVISTIAFIYGIIAIANFGSSTDIYKILIEKIKELENNPNSGSSSSSRSSSSSSSNSRYDDDDYDYYYNYWYYKKKRRVSSTSNSLAYYGYASSYYNQYGEAVLNSVSASNIAKLSYDDIKISHGPIKSLKGIENGLGVILFIFPLIFLAFEIVFLIFACGIKEYQVLSNTAFTVFNALKILCITISTILIFLSILYGILLIIALIQYIALVLNIDSCAVGIIVGMVYGYYCFWFYIVLSCAFCTERRKFYNVGSQDKPGFEAQYDINGNPIPRGTQVIQQVIIPGQIQVGNPAYIQMSSQQIGQYQQYQQIGQLQQFANLNLRQPQQFGQPQQIGQPQQFGQSQQFGQPQQSQTVDINQKPPKNNNYNAGASYRKINNNSNDMSSARINNKVE